MRARQAEKEAKAAEKAQLAAAKAEKEKERAAAAEKIAMVKQKQQNVLASFFRKKEGSSSPVKNLISRSSPAGPSSEQIYFISFGSRSNDRNRVSRASAITREAGIRLRENIQRSDHTTKCKMGRDKPMAQVRFIIDPRRRRKSFCKEHEQRFYRTGVVIRWYGAILDSVH